MLSRHWKCNRRVVVVAAVGKWESRVVCGIPKRSGFSTAVGTPRFLRCSRHRLLLLFWAQATVGQSGDALQFAFDAPAQLKRVQVLSQLSRSIERKLERISRLA